MDQSNLISILAKKYEIDITDDIGVMKLYNKLCIAMGNEGVIETLKHDLIANNDWAENKVAELDVVINALKDVILELLTGKLSEITKRKIKAITDKHGIGVDQDNKGNKVLTTPNYKLRPKSQSRP